MFENKMIVLKDGIYWLLPLKCCTISKSLIVNDHGFNQRNLKPCIINLLVPGKDWTTNCMHPIPETTSSVCI